MDILQMESIITTQLRVRVPQLTNNRFPNMSFTNEVTDNMPSFPNVFVHQIGARETGRDLDNRSIHAISNTLQVEIATNTTKSDAQIVTNACIIALKALRYSILEGQIYQKDNNIHRFVFRARRTIASGDTL